MTKASRAWRRIVRASWFWWVVCAVVVVLSGVGLTAANWCWLIRDGHSAIVSDVGLLIVAGLAGVIAAWRLAVGHRQAETQAEEARVAARSLVDSQRRSGVEMLQSDHLPVRIAGIFDLGRLAAEHPDEVHATVMDILCAFMRYPIGRVGARPPDSPAREDVQAIMDVIGDRSDAQIQLERKVLDLWNVNLRNCPLVNTSLKGALIGLADLSRAFLGNLDLSGANLQGANLTDAHLLNVDLSDCNLDGVKVSGARFDRVRGLEQADLRMMVDKEGRPPTLNMVKDAKTGKDLVWKGGRDDG